MHAPGAIPAADRVEITASAAERSPAAASSALVRALAYSSGRMLALCRAMLAGLFLLALVLDPSQPVRTPGLGYGLLVIYLAIALILLRVSWRDWWADYRLGRLTLVLDIASFLGAVVITEGQSNDFTSPFMAFFAYLMLAAAVRFGWRATLATGLVVTLGYLALGVVMAAAHLQFNPYRFERRLSYMVVLALVMAWFSMRRRDQHVDRFVEPVTADSGSELPLQAALRYAAEQTFARDALIAWADFEEPHTRLYALGTITAPPRLAPDRFDPERDFGTSARVFERKHGRCLRAKADGRVEPCPPMRERLAEVTGIREALAFPVAGPSGRGEIVLVGIPGLCSDHVQLAVPLAREISAAFDRQAGLALAAERALIPMRDALARELHDTVAQSLSAAALRLEGLRTWIGQGGDPAPEIDAMKQSLRQEQRHVRSLIARLRLGTVAQGSVEAAAALRALLPALDAHWGVTVRLTAPDRATVIPSWLGHELSQILREAVANAVRHGHASEIELVLGGDDNALSLEIADNGTGLPEDRQDVRPWSIEERVARLGGELSLVPRAHGACLRLVVPRESA